MKLLVESIVQNVNIFIIVDFILFLSHNIINLKNEMGRAFTNNVTRLECSQSFNTNLHEREIQENLDERIYIKININVSVSVVSG